MQLNNRHVGILVAPAYEDLEFWVPYMRMIEEGARVTIIAAQAGVSYPSKSGGLHATSQASAADIRPVDLDALIVPGGWAPDKLRRDEHILKLVRDLHAAGKILAFICHAGWVAASAGIVKGRKVTGSAGIKDDMQNAGAQWADEAAFRDGHFVWGRVVEDIPAFCRVLVQALQDKEL